jgi:hypothetical protein
MGGCTGTFVSPDGLVVIHRSCITSCLATSAAATRSKALLGETCRDKALRRALPLFDLLYCAPLDRKERRQTDRASFLAPTPAEEVVCSDRYLRQLLSVEDVTDQMKQALDRPGTVDVLAAERAQSRALQVACSAGGRFECDVAASYEGARYELHRYRAFRDVRLVFSPEATAAGFGVQGSPHTFPQHRFEAAFVRVYDSGRPARTPYLKLAHASPREGDLVFVAGFSPTTARYRSLANLQVMREQGAWTLLLNTEARGTIYQYLKDTGARTGGRIVDDIDGSVSNMRVALDAINPALLARTQESERLLRARVDQDARLRQRYAQAWDAQARAISDSLRFGRRLVVDSSGCGALFGTAKTLVRAPEERAKPNKDRLNAFTDANLSGTERLVLRPIVFDEDLETEILAFCLRVFRNELGYGDPLIAQMLEGRSPDEAARHLLRHSRLPDLSVRKALWQGGRQAIQASRDPLVMMWRRIDGQLRRTIKQFEDEVLDPLARADRLIGQARYEVYGTNVYPDGNGTLRLRYGKVAGTALPAGNVPAFTPLGALYRLATGRAPFELAAPWHRARPHLDQGLPLAFTTDADAVIAVPGRSDKGAPVINRDLTVAGMVSGGNQANAAATFDYDAEAARAVALNSAAILAVLEHVYSAGALVAELRGARR